MPHLRDMVSANEQTLLSYVRLPRPQGMTSNVAKNRQDPVRPFILSGAPPIVRSG
jgi:hypothetical protein